jgi:Lrp/AsnC family leucine-responsive transcriptional regulator
MNALVGVFITDNADTDKIAEQLAAMPEVEHCWFVAGEETFVIKVRVADVAGLERTIRALNAASGIARTRTTVVLSTKFEDRVLPASEQ